MGEETGIKWTNSTHNFWYGCRKVSSGCKLCYAEREMSRFGRDFGTVVRAKGFNKPLAWREPRLVFVNSWSDFFISDADGWRDDAWDIIKKTPHLTYQILTKRPDNIAERLPKDWGDGWENVWLGVSTENQSVADRFRTLYEIPAKLRFVSAEPLLGPLDFGVYGKAVDWVIVGGESGPDARPMELEWARSIIKQCGYSNVPVFVKQLGGWPNKRDKPEEWPEDLRIQEFPKFGETSH